MTEHVGEITGIKHKMVIIGASAGGLDPITKFFSLMPSNTGMSFVVIQHLSPDHKSMMSDLIKKNTSMKVEVISSNTSPQPNSIYLIPPTKNIIYKSGKFELLDRNRQSLSPNLPVDIFLESAAEELGEQCISVILSGTGSDGTKGCRFVRDYGGITVAQSPTSAKFSGMPESIINRGLADFVADVEDIPQILSHYVDYRYSLANEQNTVSLSPENKALSQIFTILRTHSKVDFSSYKEPTVMRRIQRRMSITQSFTLSDYADYIKDNREESSALFKDMLIGVTSFLRDKKVFHNIENKYLIDYLKQQSKQDVRFWIAGCSTGEEAYSYAIMFSEIKEKLNLNMSLKLFATDIDQDALSKAAIGTYPESIVADLPAALISKYFTKNGDHFTIDRKTREMVVFAKHDIISDPPFTNIDIVSCRNLLIYFQPNIQNHVIRTFSFSLNPGGLLVLGSSESLGDSERLFDVLDSGDKVFKSIASRRLPSVRSMNGNAPYQSPTWEPSTAFTSSALERRASAEIKVLEAFLEVMSPSLLPFAMIVDNEGKVHRVIGDSRPYLTPVSGRMTSDVNKLISEDLSLPVTTGLARLFRNDEESTFTNVRLKSGKDYTKVDVTLKPLPLPRSQNKLGCIIIRPSQRGDVILTNEVVDLDEQVLRRFNDIENELQFTRENLQATIEELETSNEELQATNEELLASNEELQSTNEELQSVNEELYTVNAEHQNKISEMSELNTDLENLLSVTKGAFIFLDSDLKIRRFSPQITRVFNIIEHDIGRPFEHISHQIKDFDVFEAVVKSVETNSTIESTVSVTKHGKFLIQIAPYLINSYTTSGLMILMTKMP